MAAATPDAYTVPVGEALRAGIAAPDVPPVDPPPPVGDLPQVFSKPINIARVLSLSEWHTSSRYERFQRLTYSAPADESSTRSMQFRCTSMSGGGTVLTFQASAYRLLVDGVEVTRTEVTAGVTKTANFIVPIGQMTTGWHELDIEAEQPTTETAPKWFIYIHRDGVEQPELMPVCTGSYDLTHGVGPVQLWAWVPRRFTPYTAPKDTTREPTHFDTHVSRTNLYRENLTPAWGGNIHRPNVNKEGIWSTFCKQNYFWQDLVRKVPQVPLLDGPRGEGTPVMLTHIQVDRHGGAYCTGPWGVLRIDPKGRVTTRAGYRHKSTQSHWEDALSDQLANTLELVGDWSAIPPERHGFHENWGLAFDLDSLALDLDAPMVRNPDTLIMENPHVIGPRAFVADSQNNRIILLTFQKDNFTAEPVVTEFITGISDPWDVVWHEGFIYVSERTANRIVKYNATTGAFVEVMVERNAALPGGSNIDSNRMHRHFGTLEERRAHPVVTPEGLFIQDGWLYFASVGNQQVRRIHLTTRELEIVVPHFYYGSINTHFAKLAVSDGTFYPRGTMFLWTWGVEDFGMPMAFKPDGTKFGLSTSGDLPSGKGGAWASPSYPSAGGVGMGRLYGASAAEGVYAVSLAKATDPALSAAKYRRGKDEYEQKGYRLIFGQSGFSPYGYAPPWGESEDMDYFLELRGHVNPASAEG